MTPFEHLHVRSVYASLYGMVRLGELAEAQRGGVACATDPMLRSAARLVKACKGKARPVHGLELVPRDAAGHLVLLALDENGWRSLKDLSARAVARVDGAEGKAKKGTSGDRSAIGAATPPTWGKSSSKGVKRAGTKAAKGAAAERTGAPPWSLGVTLADVAAARGVAVLTGGAEGALAAAWRAGGSVAADELLAGLQGVEVWVELAPTMGPLWRELWAWAALRGLPVVATGDVAYLSRRQAPAWHVLRAVADKRRADRRLLARCAEVARGGSQEAQEGPSGVGGVAGQGGKGTDAQTGFPERAAGVPDAGRLGGAAESGEATGERPGNEGERGEHGIGWRWGHLASREEMEEFFRDCPAAVRNAGELAARCWSGIKLGLVALPDYVGEDGRPLGPAEQVAELRRLARAGLAGRVGQRGEETREKREEYEERLDYELDVIAGTGFAGYFLIYADFVRWGKENGIPFGPGRGSGSGSVVVWSLGITDCDPIVHGLLFERFLNPERAIGGGMGSPDIDIDICTRRRADVIEYLRQRYGRDSVGYIATFKVLVGKTALKDAGRVLGLGFHRLNSILSGAPQNAKNAKGELKAPTVAWLVENHGPLREAAEIDPLVAETVRIAADLEECVRDCGVHACGIGVSRGPLSDWVPITTTKRGELCSQWDWHETEDAGIIKFDMLGLSTVTMLDIAAKAARVNLADLPLDDQATYGLMARGDTLGVFQMGKGGFRRMLREMRPDRFGDVVAAGALYRPGPLQGGMTRSYCARKHGREVTVQLHPLLEPVTGGTYGCFVYQEQVMSSARVLAGYSLGQADLLRRAMGKKDPVAMKRERAKFVAGCLQLGTCDEKRAGEIFDLIDYFSGYGFNVAHSTTYGMLAYRCAWLKVHHPAAFYAALLSSLTEEQDAPKKLGEAAYDMREHGVELLPPCVQRSARDFAPEGGRVRYGLSALRGLARDCAARLERGRPFRNVADLLRRAAPNKKDLAALAGSGALDELLRAEGVSRARALASLDALAKWSQRERKRVEKDERAGQHSLDFG